MRRVSSTFTCGVFVGTVVFTAGCGLILGLDEFVDAPQGVECVSPQDCPGGEHGTPTCEEGVCGFLCEEDFDDCDEEVGCEADTSKSKESCGGCGVTCSAYCIDGSCNGPIYVAAGPANACAILEDGTVWCWGAEPSPTVDFATKLHPEKVDLPAPAIQVALGGLGTGEQVGSRLHTCALLTDRTVRCWGFNDYGQVGTGGTDFAAFPIDPGLNDIAQLALGASHTCARDVRNQLFCWGYNEMGQIGDGTTIASPSPIQVGSIVAQVSAGSHHTCAVLLDGSVQCWGFNGFGGVGNGSQSNQLLPVTVLSSGAHVACGAAHTCASTSSALWCWGFNLSGQLGVYDNVDSTTPKLLGIAGVDTIAVGLFHSGALVRSDVYLWGDNAAGQLATGSPLDALEPTLVELEPVEQLTLGGLSSCVLTKTRAVLCWGDNKYGQLGDGTTVDKPAPTAVLWP